MTSAVWGAGRSGKTTIATNLASAWHSDGRSLLLLDADPQLSSMDWSDSGDGDGVSVDQLGESNLKRDLPRVGESFDLVVIDGAPRMGKQTAAAVRVADFVPSIGCRHVERRARRERL